MAGQIGEIAHDLNRGFRSFDLREAQILLVEAGNRVLQEYPPSLSAKAVRSLQSLGVTVRLNHTVTDLDEESVTLRAADGSEERIPTHTVVWAAGVIASDLASLLAERAGLDVDRSGRVEVSEDLSLPGHPEVLAIGDMIRVRRASGPPVVLPGIAPVAMQQGRHAAAVVKDRLEGRPARQFHYFDKGNLATIGRARAVADLKGIRPPFRYPPGIHLSGFIAWIAWLTVHLFYLIGFENRLLVLTRWVVSFATHGRGARLIAGGAEPARPAQTGAQPGGRQSDR
jgi:NADH dehydrogenase